MSIGAMMVMLRTKSGEKIALTGPNILQKAGESRARKCLQKAAAAGRSSVSLVSL